MPPTDTPGTPTFASPDAPGMPAPSPLTAWDFLPEGWTIAEATSHAEGCLGHQGERFRDRPIRGVPPAGFAPVTQLEHARLGRVTPAMRRAAEREGHLTPEQVRDEIAAGRMVLPASLRHLRLGLDPVAIGRAARTKINANLGASPVASSLEEEVEKVRWALRWGADTVMDLSTAGDLEACREAILRASSAPIGTVPIYSMILGRRLEELSVDDILREIERQARQGADFMTLHAGLKREHLPLTRHRLIGIVSRGGSLLAKWMLLHGRQNPMYEAWDEICDLCRRHDVTLSLGDGLRPGGLADATDEAQLAELAILGELTERAWRRGAQAMVEGPGHVPLDQIEYNMKLQRRLCHGAPFYVLGPIVTDVFPGYDHITSGIGATLAAYHGAAMLCYVTPKEHLGLPRREDVKQGCVAYKIAAHAADIALHIPGARDWDDELTRARAALHWERHFELSFDPDTARALHDQDLDRETNFCAMCGHDWCAVRLGREIAALAAGQDPRSAPEGARSSTATAAGRRGPPDGPGTLAPEETRRQETSTRRTVAPGAGRRSPCRSERSEVETSRGIVAERLSAEEGDAAEA